MISAPLGRLATRLVGELEADDVLQESLVRIYVSLRRRRYRDNGQFTAWARRICTRVALDMLRSNKRRKKREQTSAPRMVGRDPVDDIDASRQLRQLLAALEKLPANQRIAIVLKEVEGLSTADIAKAMGCSPGAVEQRLVRARVALRKKVPIE